MIDSLDFERQVIFIDKNTRQKLKIIRFNGMNKPNVFIEIDDEYEPIIKKRAWSTNPQEQKVIYIGFEKLEIIRIF